MFKRVALLNSEESSEDVKDFLKIATFTAFERL